MPEPEQIRDAMAELFAAVRPDMDAASRRLGPLGYVLVKIPRHPFASRTTGEVAEHRIVAEQMLGRFLYPTEVVHHRNHQRSDNRRENLQICLDTKEHLRYHSKRHDPGLIEMVRKAAADPKARLRDLPMSPVTARRICVEQGIRWVAADEAHLTRQQVRDAIAGRTPQEAAAILNVCAATLYRNFPDLVARRRSPGFLDNHRSKVMLVVKKQGVQAAASLFDTSRQTIWAALRRWRSDKPAGRCRPGHLDAHRDRVCRAILASVPMKQIAADLGCDTETIRRALERWSAAGGLPTDVAARLNASKNRKARLRGTA